MKLHYEILDKERKALLSKLADFRTKFYLAGGTALALRIGHRQSEDFDFFTLKSFSTSSLLDTAKSVLGKKLKVLQQEKNTLTVTTSKYVKLSFFSYPYRLVKPLEKTEYFNLASVSDIACMKLSAILSRGTLKDYVDLYYILKQARLSDILSLASKKFPELDENLILKSLVYFGDLQNESIKLSKGRLGRKEMEAFLKQTVKNYVQKVRKY